MLIRHLFFFQWTHSLQEGHRCGFSCNRLELGSFKMHVFFPSLPELANPLPSIQATWSSFFRTPKQRFARMTEKSTIDYNNVMLIMTVMLVILMVMMTKTYYYH